MALTQIEPYMVDSTATFTFANANVGNINADNISGDVTTAVTSATTVTASAQPNITSVGTLVNLSVAGVLSSAYTTETFVIKTGATGSVTHDASQSGTFYHTSPAANFTANFTNLSLTDNKLSVVVLLIQQGATPYIPVGMSIDSTPMTVNWNLGISPSGNANKIDMISYSIMKISGVWSVLGQYTTFG